MQFRLSLPRRLLGFLKKTWAIKSKSSHGATEVKPGPGEPIYKTILESLPIGVVITDLKGNVTYFGPQAAALTSFSEQSVRRVNLGQIFPGIARELNMRIQEGKEFVDNLSFDSRGETKHLKLTLIPPSKLSVQSKVFVLLLEDNTRREHLRKMVRLEEKLVAAKQHEAAEQGRAMLGKGFQFEGAVGRSQEMQRVYRLIQKAAGTTVNVLITGESGTGKEMVARAIHMNGPCRNKAFISVYSGGISETLLEDELFGHVRGAFTGAVSDYPGRLKLADGGTLFLDEVERLPQHVQVKLLKGLEDRSFTPVGGSSPLAVDLRVITASNKNLKEEVDKGRLRDDLFYRLSVIRIDLPPLRNRKEDIPFLLQHFINKFAQAFNKQVEDISPEALRYLMYYNYPQNIRELESIIEHAVAVTERDVLTEGDLALYGRESLPSHLEPVVSVEDEKLLEITGPAGEGPFFDRGSSLDDAVVFYEKTLLLAALKKAGGVQKKAAELLGINYRSLRHRLEKYGMLESKFTRGSGNKDAQ